MASTTQSICLKNQNLILYSFADAFLPSEL
jgi:hypothetical protein